MLYIIIIIYYGGLPVIDEGLLKKYNARTNYVITIIITYYNQGV
jgi:hypothetical protein